jgi:hypothetical protein
MLALQLHHHIEHVETVVNTATKELQIERTLNTIEAIWTAMTLEFDVYKDTGVKLVSVSDFVLDKLEEFWPLFRKLKVLTKEAAAFWKLVAEAGGGGGGRAGARAGPTNVALGTMASRQVVDDV